MVDCFGEVGEVDGCLYKRRALIYEQLAELDGTELIRGWVCRQLRSKRQRAPERYESEL